MSVKVTDGRYDASVELEMGPYPGTVSNSSVLVVGNPRSAEPAPAPAAKPQRKKSSGWMFWR